MGLHVVCIRILDPPQVRVTAAIVVRGCFAFVSAERLYLSEFIVPQVRNTLG